VPAFAPKRTPGHCSRGVPDVCIRACEVRFLGLDPSILRDVRAPVAAFTLRGWVGTYWNLVIVEVVVAVHENVVLMPCHVPVAISVPVPLRLMTSFCTEPVASNLFF
jgi:hypothetical protein